MFAAFEFGFVPPTPTNSRPIKVSITCRSRASIFPPREFGLISVESVIKYKICFERNRFSTKSSDKQYFLYSTASVPVLSASIAKVISGTFPLVSTISPSPPVCVVSEVFTGNQNSLIFRSVPSAKVTIANSASIVPVAVSTFSSLVTSRLIFTTPNSFSVFNSPESDIPL